jgi:hypothetical protein
MPEVELRNVASVTNGMFKAQIGPKIQTLGRNRKYNEK